MAAQRAPPGGTVPRHPLSLIAMERLFRHCLLLLLAAWFGLGTGLASSADMPEVHVQADGQAHAVPAACDGDFDPQDYPLAQSGVEGVDGEEAVIPHLLSVPASVRVRGERPRPLVALADPFLGLPQRPPSV